MTTEYTIAAIPTLYRGRMYRSRLEARWAAFFDRLGWTHEYEPFDLGKWSPDFAITEPFDALVEVKPLTEFDPDVAEKMDDAQHGVKLLTRVAPVRFGSFVEIGWLTVSHCSALLLWRAMDDKPAFYADLLLFIYDHDKGEVVNSVWASTRELMMPGVHPSNARSFGDHTMKLWADACNAVQWEPQQ